MGRQDRMGGKERKSTGCPTQEMGRQKSGLPYLHYLLGPIPLGKMEPINRRISGSTTAFLEAAPRNISTGVDYCHQVAPNCS